MNFSRKLHLKILIIVSSRNSNDKNEWIKKCRVCGKGTLGVTGLNNGKLYAD